jgi:hypothetical protein
MLRPQLTRDAVAILEHTRLVVIRAPETSFEQALSDLFGQRVIGADHKSQRPLRGLTSQCIEQVAIEREDFVG